MGDLIEPRLNIGTESCIHSFKHNAIDKFQSNHSHSRIKMGGDEV